MSLPGWNTRWQIEADEKVFYDTLGALGKELDALRDQVRQLHESLRDLLLKIQTGHGRRAWAYGIERPSLQEIKDTDMDWWGSGESLAKDWKLLAATEPDAVDA